MRAVSIHMHQHLTMTSICYQSIFPGYRRDPPPKMKLHSSCDMSWAVNAHPILHSASNIFIILIRKHRRSRLSMRYMADCYNSCYDNLALYPNVDGLSVMGADPISHNPKYDDVCLHTRVHGTRTELANLVEVNDQ